MAQILYKLSLPCHFKAFKGLLRYRLVHYVRSSQVAMPSEDEDVYVNPSYATNAVTFRQACPLPETPPLDSASAPEEEKELNIWKKIFLAFAAVVLLVLLVVNTALCASLYSSSQSSSAATNFGKVDSKAPVHAASCKELAKNGSSESGIYLLQPDSKTPAVEVYCDMETDGGGWTLVVSINEGDIQRKCYSDDVWSSYVPGYQSSLTGKTNWDNEMTFGSVRKCVEDDYKNFAYFNLSADDLMIWHVQLGFHLDLIRSRSTFRYRSTNGFLNKYGGNLKSLFSEHLPLKIKTDDSNMDVLSGLVKVSNVIKSEIPNWYNYPAPSSGATSIRDTEMYNPYGNAIIFKSSLQQYGYLMFGKKYRYYASHTFAEGSVSTTPFIFVAEIWNENGIASEFTIEEQSKRQTYNSEETIFQFKGTVTLGNYLLQFGAVQFFHASYHTPCGFFFSVSNKQKWNSTEAEFGRFYAYYVATNRYTRYGLKGNPKKMLFGYILLASQRGNNLTIENLYNVSQVVLQAIANTKDVFKVRSDEDTLTVPIVFDKGSSSEIMKMIPPSSRPYVQPGYLQFRAYNYTGYPSAICPAVKVASISPEYVCIGGISGDIEEHGTCGDFAGWGGQSDDSLHSTESTGFAHSHLDLSSTILLFYR